MYELHLEELIEVRKINMLFIYYPLEYIAEAKRHIDERHKNGDAVATVLSNYDSQ